MAVAAQRKKYDDRSSNITRTRSNRYLRSEHAERDSSRTRETAVRTATTLRKHLLRVSKAIPRQVVEQASSIKSILDIAAASSTNAYILQGPGALTRFWFTSPAERSYEQARALAIKYEDQHLASAIAVIAVKRFKAIDQHDRAFEWAKISGNRDVLSQTGIWAAKHYASRASTAENTFISNERHLSDYQRAIAFARDSGNIQLAREIGHGAAQRSVEFGHKAARDPFSSIVGLVFGHIRAIRIEEACEHFTHAQEIRDFIVDIYQNNHLINPISLAVAGAIGDRKQREIIREILEHRKTKSI